MSLADAVVNWLRPYRFRGKGRLFGRFIPTQGVRHAVVFGGRLELDLSDLIQRQVYLGVYEREETNLVLGYLQPGMTFVDVGANIGYYTLMAASRVGPSGRVFSVEPSQYAVERLEKTVRENHLSQVTVVRGGLSDRASEERLFIPEPGNHTPTMLGEANAPSTAIQVKTLDVCLSEWNVERVDLIKIDVEGFEPRVLGGAAQAMAAGRIRAILCEFNDYWLRRAGTSGRQLYEKLVAAGYGDRAGTPAAFDDKVLTRLLVRS